MSLSIFQFKLSKLQLYRELDKIFLYTFLFFLLGQLFFWAKTEHIKPSVHIVPPLPSKYSVEALSLGDKEFYFRVLAMKIQNAGDTFGRFTPLKEYDYEKLYQWWKILDELNNKSNLVPALASYYYSQTQKTEDNIYVVRYLDDYASRDIDKNWWWMYQATYIANSILQDHQLALKLAYKLSKNEAKNAPLWTKQAPAFVHQALGEDCQAFAVISQILKENENGTRIIKPEELSFMRHFINERLNNLKKKGFNPLKCKYKK